MGGKQARAWLSITAFCVLIGLWAAVSLSETASAAEWSKWQSPRQATFYTDLYGSASGISLTKHRCVAVDMGRVVSKKKWKKGSEKFKRTHFYYGQKIQLQHLAKKKKAVTLVVADCGSFGGAGQCWKGAWRSRWFDIAGYANAKKVGITWDEGVGMVRWRYAR